MSSIYSGIKKVNPVGSMNKPNTTHTPPKQQDTQQDKKPPKKKDKDSIVDIYAEESDYSDFQHRLKNITAQNPAGSAAEKLILNRYLASPESAYARNVIGVKDAKGWIAHAHEWLQKIKRDLQNKYPEADLSDLEELAHKMYEDYLARIGQLEEGKVVPMQRQARKTPLVVAGEPYDWDIYDLRTNKMVANILGGDRHDKPLYEIRINSNGMTPSTRMLPTYVLKAGPNNNPPYRAYELEAPSEVDKIEKSQGPGGTTKLKPDTMDVFSHIAKQTAKGRYWGYDMILVEEGLDQYEIIEKALGAEIMEIDDAMELGYTDWNEDDGSGYPILYLGNQNMKESVAMSSNKDLDVVTKAIVNYVRKNKMDLLKKHGVRSVIAGIQDIAQQHSTTPEKSISDVNIWAKELENMLGRGKYKEVGEGYSAGAVGGAGLGINEFLDTGGGDGGGNDDDMKRQVIEMYFEDGLRETEISKITGLSEIAVNNIIDQYERGEFKLDEGDVIVGPWPGSGLKPQQDKIQAPVQDKKPLSQNISNILISAEKVMKFIQKRGIVNIDDPYKDIEDALRALRIKYNQKQVFDIWQRMKQTRFAKKMRYDDISVDEGQIYSTGGGAGQGYHWYKPQPAGLKEYADTTAQINYESAIMKGLQSEEIGNDRELRRQKRSQEIDSQIKKAYPYLVRNSKTGLEKEFMNMDDAIKFAQQEALPSLDSATVVYDRNSKFPVVAYRGSEEVYTQRNKMSEYGEVDSSRKKEFSKDNPPSLDMLYRQFIQTMTSDQNTIEPKVWIDSANKNYGLNYTYKNYQDFGHKNDHVGGWDKFIKKHVLGK